MCIMRYIVNLRMSKQRGHCPKVTSIWKKRFIVPLVFEIFLALIHPNMALYKHTYVTNINWNMIGVSYNINDFLCLIAISRIYIIARTMIAMTDFYSLRMDRIASVVGLKISYSFSLRCILSSSPYKFILIAITLTVLSTSYMLKIVEGPVIQIDENSKNAKIDYSDYGNCFWNVLVTMTTVGYGDYYPKTNLGRFIAIITSVIGLVLLCFLVIALNSNFNLSVNEEKVIFLINKYRLVQK
jgi:hypothetical protein